MGSEAGLRRRAFRDKVLAAKRLREEATPEEQALWQHLRRNRMCGQHFRRQHVVRGFIVDFYCHAAKLVIELDGAQHNEASAADAERDAILEGMGLQVLRIPNRQLREDLPRVLDLIGDGVKRRVGLVSIPPSNDGGRGTGG